jgi:hypothetical protein
MLMLIWIYRVALAKFLYFASSGVLLVIGMFMLKRGVYAHRPKLRTFAFGMIFAAVFKIFMLDLRFADEYLLCAGHTVRQVAEQGGFDAEESPILSFLPCSGQGTMILDFAGIVLFILAGLSVFHAYRVFMPEKDRNPLQPEQVHLRFWANLNLWGIVAMLCWLAAPWFCFLTVGFLPRVFTLVPWQDFALANLALLLFAFWKSEGCAWSYDIRKKDKMKHLNDTWTPRDTLWLNTFLYVIALALSWVSQDVLSPHHAGLAQ